MSIIIFIIILGILIFVHELGHFLVAKKTGIRVDEFAIGFPPKLLSWTKNGTKYALNLIPFGGYVKIFGENPDEDSLAKEAEDSFVNKSKFTQAAVLIAGVVFNVVFAWILFSISFMIGFDVSKDNFAFVDNSQSKIQIIAVGENSPAERNNLEQGTEIFGLTKAEQYYDFDGSQSATEFIRNTEAPFTLNTSEGEVMFDSKLSTDEGEVIGLFLDDIVNTKTNFFNSFVQGFHLIGFSLTEITIALRDLIIDSFRGEAELENIAGPVGIVGMVGDAAESGFVNLLIFTAFISVNLAIINMVPFPALDGGRLLFILIETITRRNINHKVANVLNLVGFLILIGLMIIITISDVGKLF